MIVLVRSIDDLLALEDETFILHAYRFILAREADKEGMEYYLGRLRKGIEKIEIITQLRISSEGKRITEPLSGMDEVIKYHQRKKIPFIGHLLSWLDAKDQQATQFNIIENKMSRLKNGMDAIEKSTTEQIQSLRSEIYSLLDTSNDVRVGGFDIEWYLEQNKDVAEIGIDPYEHYLLHGWQEGRRPNKWFDPQFYVKTYLSEIETNIEPLEHYLTVGAKLGYQPNKNIGNNHDFYNNMQLQNNAAEYQKNYIDYIEHDNIATDIKMIAFYLPQFHPISQNDQAWGKGFTEWTNVSKAIPQFNGHYQPRLPGELGYYDLRLIDVQRRQIELAKNYGIHGFCYHYYWFDGQKIMDRPLQQIIDNPDLDFPFCINWANENWTKRWDGLDQEVILKQNHSPEDDNAFLKAIMPILMDKRYIRIDDKPVLMIYRPQLFPNIRETVKLWRKEAKRLGIGELYLVLTHAFEHINPNEIGFDAAVEFAPNSFQVTNITDKVVPYNDEYYGAVYDYSSAVNYSISYEEPEYLKFRGICPSWDNEARKPGKGTTFFHANPENYQKWLEYICYYTQQHRKQNQRFIFLNAWNEWAEGAYLEPDRKLGYAYLESTYQVLNKFTKNRLNILDSSHKNIKKADTAIVLHLYYIDLWAEIKEEFKNFKDPFDLYININNNATDEEIISIHKDYPNAVLFSCENRGRDILPFLEMMKVIDERKYKYICKIHTKKSLHRVDGDQWRNHLIQSLIGSQERISKAKKLLSSDTGIVVARDNIFPYQLWIGSNMAMIKAFAKKANIQVPDDFTFPAGSMFWFKPELMKPLIQYMESSEFVFEEGQIDGTIAHAGERIFGLLCAIKGYKIEEI
jgi:lipopolysaccharide biosynthesis protein